jgi:coproporphyrinogen III oxidase-like Fe-S oxidoreductase
VKHPRDYAARLAGRESPAAARELLSARDRATEDIMLRLRLRLGLALGELSPAQQATARIAHADGLLEPAAYQAGRAVLTLRGRLLADGVSRDLVE